MEEPAINSSNGKTPVPDGDPAANAAWLRLVGEWFEEQAALVVAELERPGGASAAPEVARADRER